MDASKLLSKIIIDDTPYETRLTKKFIKRKPYIEADPKKIFAFIPGIITEIKVYEGQKISRGQSILILEAMKMLNEVKCPMDGRIKAIHIKKSQMVVKGQLLVELE
ncbi:MAG: acetyl-CoA carboxylase biotin carboxyl carrier protein subunit [Ignavibacteriaceae bacterium]|nr:acetyl-CoA carboxylase biotin carboxyl carrier protein subunit [Ignavibacteriaceae bacterium]